MQFIVLAILVLISFFFSAAETALTSLDRIQLRKLLEEKKIKSLKVWVEHPNKLMATILVGNNIVNLTAAAITANMAVHFAEKLKLSESISVVIATVIITLVILILGEITPKTYAKYSSERVAIWTINLLVLFNYLLEPLIKGLVWITNPIVKFLGGKTQREIPFVTEEEIRLLIAEGVREGLLEKDQKEMIHSVLTFGDKIVREIMIPRIDMACVDINNEKEKFIDLVVETGHARVPVYKGSLDNIIGIIHGKDLLTAWRNNELIIIQDLIRPAYFVPETKKVNKLLREMQKGRLHMAIVVDEYGVPAGLVTVEDLVEEIVGNILDEYAIEELGIEPLSDGGILVEGKLNIYQINERLKIDLPSEDFNTIAGLVVDLVGRVPKKGEEIKYKNFKFIVVEANRRRVIKLKIMKESTEGTK